MKEQLRKETNFGHFRVKMNFVSEAESLVSVFKQNFDDARSVCRNSYSMSDYKVLFGLLQDDLERIGLNYYLGNFRVADNTKNKGKLSVIRILKKGFYTSICLLNHSQ